MNKIFSIFLFSILIIACKPSKVMTEDDYYWSFKPVYDSQEKALRWGACSNKENLDEIPGYLFIPVDQNNNFRKGLPYKQSGEKYTTDDYIAYLPIRYHYDVFRQKNATVSNYNASYASEAFSSNSPEYDYFKNNMDCNQEGNCTNTSEYNINKLGTNCANPDGSYRPPMCSIIAYPFDSKVLTNTNFKNTELQCSYQSDRIYPTLKADMYTETCQADYVFDGVKDKPDGLRDNNRYVYINVVVKPPEDVTADYYVLFTDPNKSGKPQGISLKRGAFSPDTIRYCQGTRDELRYVIKFQLSGGGNYLASLHNWDSRNNNVSAAIETTAFSVNTIDQYNDANSNISLNRTNRKLVLQPLSITNMPLVSTLSVEGKSNFTSTLETAFSLNEKKPLSTSNNPDLLRKGIDFTVNAPTTFASRYFDNYGNIR